MTISDKTIGRLGFYRRILYRFQREGRTHTYSHEIGLATGATPAQVRRDLMVIGYSGSPNRGYRVAKLIVSIGDFLDAPEGQNVALFGVGNLGRAVLAYFAGRRPKLSIVAAFDVLPERADRVVHGCRCYAAEEFPALARREQISVGIITVPADAAQEVADLMVRCGVSGILNFAPVSLNVPPGVYVQDMDVAVALEKVAYFARHNAAGSKNTEG